MQYDFLVRLQELSSPLLDAAANILSLLGEQGVMIVILVVIYYIVGKKEAFAVFSSLLLAEVATNGIKAIVRAPRPFMVHPELAAGRLETATGYSFPSGHTTGAAAFYPALARQARRPWAIALAVVLAILIGLSRNYLAVHWPVDVIVGLMIGLVASLALSPHLAKLYEDEERRLKFCRLACPISLAAALLLTAHMSLLGGDERAYGDLMRLLALSGGAWAGCILETRKVSFRVQRKPSKAMAVIGITLAGVIVIMALKPLFPNPFDQLGAFIRYSVLGLWAIGLSPFLCLRLGLLDSASSDS